MSYIFIHSFFRYSSIASSTMFCDKLLNVSIKRCLSFRSVMEGRIKATAGPGWCAKRGSLTYNHLTTPNNCGPQNCGLVCCSTPRIALNATLRLCLELASDTHDPASCPIFDSQQDQDQDSLDARSPEENFGVSRWRSLIVWCVRCTGALIPSMFPKVV